MKSKSTACELLCRKDSFITHRAFCDALAEESARLSILAQNPNNNITTTTQYFNPQNPPSSLPPPPPPSLLPFSSLHHHRRYFRNPWDPQLENPNPHAQNQVHIKHETLHIPLSSPLYSQMTSPFVDLHVSTNPAPLSATALLQKAATVGAVGHAGSTMAHLDMQWQKSDRFTRDFLGLTGDQCSNGGEGAAGTSSSSGNVREILSYTAGVDLPVYHSHGFGFTETCSSWGHC